MQINESTKLAQLTNKSTNKDVEYYITECANVLGLKGKVDINNPRAVLVHIFNTIMKFKMNPTSAPS